MKGGSSPSYNTAGDGGITSYRLQVTLKMLFTTLTSLVVFLHLVTAQEVNVWTTDARSQNKKDLLSFTGQRTFAPDQTTGQYLIDVDEQMSYQTVDGFGITLSDSSAWLLWNKMTDYRRDLFLRSVFDRQSGIGLNVVRIAIGASEFSMSNFTYDDTCCDLTDFTIEHDRKYIIPILKTIRKWNPDLIIMGIVWSPPSWMKTSESVVGGKLKKTEQSNFATYITKFVQAYRHEGLQIYGVVIQNEPIHESCCYPSMFMDAREQARIIRTKLGPVFRKYNLPTKIFIYGQDWENVEYPLEVLSDPEAKPYIAGTAFTCYGGSSEKQRELIKAHPEKDIWLVECGDGLWNNKGKFEPLFINSVSEDIINPLRNFARGVLKRNLILNQNNGPSNAGCKDCLGMTTLNETTGTITYNSAYYSFGHVSRFVRSGSTRIQSTTFSGDLNTVAFQNPAGNKIVVVNNKAEVANMFKIRWGNSSFSYTLNPRSAATFTWNGRQSPRPAFDRIEAEGFSYQVGTVLEKCSDTSGCGDNVGRIDAGDYLQYSAINFGDTGINSLAIRYASASTEQGLLEIRLDALDGKFLGLLQLTPTGGWQTWKTISNRVRTVKGVRDLFLIFRGGDPSVGNVNWFVFNRTPSPTIFNTLVLNLNATYKIVAKDQDKVLEAHKGNTAAGWEIKLADTSKNDYQKFIFRSVGRGCYKISVKNANDLAIGFDESYGDSDGAPLVQRPDTNAANQRWRILRVNDGYSQIVSCTNGKVWDATTSRLNLHTDQSDREQRFSMVTVE